jgi:hypothetical protein
MEPSEPVKMAVLNSICLAYEAVIHYIAEIEHG